MNKEKDDTRQIAFEAISQVLEKNRSLDVVLDQLLSRHADARDKAAAYRLIVCCLRQKGVLEAIIEPLLRRAPPQKVLWILLLGVAQIIFLETPRHAAINTTVNLTRKNGFSGFTGLVNAVLRKVADKGQESLEGLDQERLNLPTWLWQEWDKAGFNPRKLAQCLSYEVPLDLSVKAGITPPEGGTFLCADSYRYPVGTKVNTLPGFNDGQFWVQDVAASLPAFLLRVQNGEKVADLCAAPGGKTAQLIIAGGQVVAVEKDPKRIKRLKENLDRLQLQAKIVQSDAAQLNYKAEFDAILLDAPCSATGIFRRHPDVLHIKKSKEVGALVKIQRELIEAALQYLKPGGRLMYSVCSLQAQEAEEQARYIATLPGVTAQPFTSEDIPFLPESLTEEGWIRTLPFMWSEKGGLDGFFVARFKKL
ncbi:RsmB/NOP family class I SAM-dependent RNA methyltransferase [Commensalibacter papalotli (ex Servin-Garciduenas et al. 2014)]|uniref:tRNA/rRNA cytosine-C5-methylase Nol1/Nop2/Sun n=1 Tax=Commensalibacter papalotli (ex Servin-Garciduenas et al. 2014) TaxID=1208583 RepID=W7DW68_9PROT|nr:transcription antitermination factor NusB [Commensalibacter papalotli (ex Servin-Garciduenas et al. 2014)]EUK19315.1 tRNA/rRNA cytosine-C5-methylase Nol1/Nop2/Sun [Commensalibacter papalotli (ex Servin-Garciduenas et al. 2014)]